MATTPVWFPLLAAFLAGLLTIGSVVLTQRNANHREDVRWDRERERERATWARDDAARSYEHRRDAYAGFIKEFHLRRVVFIGTDKMLDTEFSAGFRGESHPPRDNFPFDYLDALYGHLVQIEIFGTKEAAKLAGDAYDALYSRVFHWEEIPDDVLAPLRSEIRRDLSIPARPL